MRLGDSGLERLETVGESKAGSVVQLAVGFKWGHLNEKPSISSEVILTTLRETETAAGDSCHADSSTYSPDVYSTATT